MTAREYFPVAPRIAKSLIYGMDSDAFIMKLRERIENDPDLTASGLSRKAGVDVSTIRKMLTIEGASPRIATAQKICEALGTTIEDFMSDRPDPVRDEIVRLYSQLSSDERRFLLKAAKGLIGTGGQ